MLGLGVGRYGNRVRTNLVNVGGCRQNCVYVSSQVLSIGAGILVRTRRQEMVIASIAVVEVYELDRTAAYRIEIISRPTTQGERPLRAGNNCVPGKVVPG